MSKLKHSIITLFFGLLFVSSINGETDYSLARVKKVNGKLAFLWNEPISEYEVVFTFDNGIENYNCLAPIQIIEASLENANKETINQEKFYDAVILGNTNKDVAIKWKNKEKNNDTARVIKNEGKYVFAECEPIANYDVVGKYDVSGTSHQVLFGECLTQNEKIEKLIKKGNKLKQGFDAVMYGSTKYDLVVKFK